MRALAAALLLLTASWPAGNADSEGDDDDNESDTAPFMIVVEHRLQPAWHCSGSLVSLRTGVTSAECARGPAAAPAQHELWVLAAATAAGLVPRGDGARRVSRLATAGTAAQSGSEAEEERYSGYSAKHDLAVLELASPFGSAARARPILMATSPQECTESEVCHVVRAAWRGAAAGPGVAGAGVRRARLRIVDATLAPEAACVTAIHQWMSLRERALCLTGPELCTGERGGGVVCAGKLCGVVSRSGPQRSPHACGSVHAAQSVARWRRFLHCAHTLRACGRGACAELCSERRLQPDDEAEGEGDEGEPGEARGGGAALGPPPRSPRPAPRPRPATHSALRAGPTHSVPPPKPPSPLPFDFTDDEVTKYKVNVKPTRMSHAPQPTSVSRAAAEEGAEAEAEAGTEVGTEAGTIANKQDDKPLPWTGVGEGEGDNEPESGAGEAEPAPAPAVRTSQPSAPLRRDPPVPRRTSSPAASVYIASSSESADSAESGENDTPATTPTPTATAPLAARPPSAPRRRRPPTPTPRPTKAAAPRGNRYRGGAGAPLSSVSIRPTPLFEPNRPDFRAGEYGDNAAEYGAPDDGGGGGGGGGSGAAADVAPGPNTPPLPYSGPGTPRLASLLSRPFTLPPEPTESEPSDGKDHSLGDHGAPRNQRPPVRQPPVAFASADSAPFDSRHKTALSDLTHKTAGKKAESALQNEAATPPSRTKHITTSLFLVLATLFL